MCDICGVLFRNFFVTISNTITMGEILLTIK